MIFNINISFLDIFNVFKFNFLFGTKAMKKSYFYLIKNNVENFINYTAFAIISSIAIFLLFVISFFLNLEPLFKFFSQLQIMSIISFFTVNNTIIENFTENGIIIGNGLPNILPTLILIGTLIISYFFIFGYIENKGKELPIKEDSSEKFIHLFPIITILISGSVFFLTYSLFILQNCSLLEIMTFFLIFWPLLVLHWIITSNFNSIITNFEKITIISQFSLKQYEALNLKNPSRQRSLFSYLPRTMNLIFFSSLLSIYVLSVYNFNIISILLVNFVFLLIYYDLSVINKMPLKMSSIKLKTAEIIEPIYQLNDSTKGHLLILSKELGLAKLMKDSVEIITDYKEK